MEYPLKFGFQSLWQAPYSLVRGKITCIGNNAALGLDMFIKEGRRKMKIPLILMAAFLLVFSAAGSSDAYLYTEEYTGEQSMAFRDQFVFGFDFVDSTNNTDTSSLVLTSDVSGITSSGNSAKVFVDFSDFGSSDETGVALEVLGGGGTVWSNLAFISGPVAGDTWEYDLTSTQINNIPGIEDGEADIRIRPTHGTFNITRVAMQVDAAAPVPEPATMLLLGAGLVGLAGLRSRFKKS